MICGRHAPECPGIKHENILLLVKLPKGTSTCTWFARYLRCHVLVYIPLQRLKSSARFFTWQLGCVLLREAFHPAHMDFRGISTPVIHACHQASIACDVTLSRNHHRFCRCDLNLHRHLIYMYVIVSYARLSTYCKPLHPKGGQ